MISGAASTKPRVTSRSNTSRSAPSAASRRSRQATCCRWTTSGGSWNWSPGRRAPCGARRKVESSKSKVEKCVERLVGMLELVVRHQPSGRVTIRSRESLGPRVVQPRPEDGVLARVADVTARENGGRRLPERQRTRPEISLVHPIVHDERIVTGRVASFPPGWIPSVYRSPAEETVRKERVEKPDHVFDGTIRCRREVRLRWPQDEAFRRDVAHCDAGTQITRPYPGITDVRMLCRERRNQIAGCAQVKPTVLEPFDQRGDQTLAKRHGYRPHPAYCGRLKSPPYTALPRICPCIALKTLARVSNASAAGTTSSFVSSA